MLQPFRELTGDVQAQSAQPHNSNCGAIAASTHDYTRLTATVLKFADQALYSNRQRRRGSLYSLLMSCDTRILSPP